MLFCQGNVIEMSGNFERTQMWQPCDWACSSWGGGGVPLCKTKGSPPGPVLTTWGRGVTGHLYGMGPGPRQDRTAPFPHRTRLCIPHAAGSTPLAVMQEGFLSIGS